MKEGKEKPIVIKVFINKFLAILCYYIFINIPTLFERALMCDLCYILFVLLKT